MDEPISPGLANPATAHVHPGLPTMVATLLRWGKAKCAFRGLFFTTDDLTEADLLVPTSAE